jgi:hypothetical protein
MSKHTPGPWTFDSFSFGAPDAPISHKKIVGPLNADGSKHLIAEVHMNHPAHEADGRLLAAAPDLLLSCMELREACAACFRVIAHRSETVDEMEAELKRVGLKPAFGVRGQEAITKATGEEKPTLMQFGLYANEGEGL